MEEGKKKRKELYITKGVTNTNMSREGREGFGRKKGVRKECREATSVLTSVMACSTLGSSSCTVN